GKLAPEQVIALERQQAQDPELSPFQAEHGEDESARVGAHQEGGGGEREQADPRLKAAADLLLVELADVGEVQDGQGQEDQNLGPLGRIAAERAKVLDDEKA